jgi:alpha-tubulin suppressor-like RCC1 family protein
MQLYTILHSGLHGQLGVSDSVMDSYTTVPKQVPAFADANAPRVVKASCGLQHMAVLTTDGRVHVGSASALV